MAELRITPRITGLITRTNGIKTRYQFNAVTNSFQNTRNHTIAGNIINGQLAIYSGGMPVIRSKCQHGGKPFNVRSKEFQARYKAALVKLNSITTWKRSDSFETDRALLTSAVSYIDRPAKDVILFMYLSGYTGSPYALSHGAISYLIHERLHNKSASKEMKEITALTKRLIVAFTETLTAVEGSGLSIEAFYQNCFPSLINKAISLDPADPIGSLDGLLKKAYVLLENEIYPFPILIDPLSEGRVSISELRGRIARLYKNDKDDYHFADLIDLALCSSLKPKWLFRHGQTTYYFNCGRIASRISSWLSKHPDICGLENDFPAFTVTGKGDVIIADDVFNGELIDSHYTGLVRSVNEYCPNILCFHKNALLTPEEQARFERRVVAHMQILLAIRDGKLHRDHKASNNELRHLERRQASLSLEDICRSMGEFDMVDAQIGMYLTALGALFNAVMNKQTAKAEYFRKFIMFELLAAVGESQIFDIFSSSGHNYKDKLEALRQIYQDRIRHIPDAARVPLPDDIRKMIDERFAELKGEYQKLGLAVNQANVEEYNIVPAGIEALFRGYIGMDCSKDGNVPLWAFNPNNAYLIIKKGDKIKGYIGLTKCVTPEGKRVLLVDTMQPCPPGMVEPILRTLEKLAKERGYKGIAIGDTLEGSFNYHDTVMAVKNLPAYKNGTRIKLEPEDKASWDLYEETISADDYHTLNLNSSQVPRENNPYHGRREKPAGDFILLNLGHKKKEPAGGSEING